MADNPQERYERIALDLTKVILEETKMHGEKRKKDEILQIYIDSYEVVNFKEMPSKDS